MTDEMLTAAQLSERLSLPANQVRSWVQRGELRARGTVRIAPKGKAARLIGTYSLAVAEKLAAAYRAKARATT